MKTEVNSEDVSEETNQERYQRYVQDVDKESKDADFLNTTPKSVQDKLPEDFSILITSTTAIGGFLSTTLTIFLYIVLFSSTVSSARTELNIPYSPEYAVCDGAFLLMPLLLALYFAQLQTEISARKLLYYWLFRQGIILDFTNYKATIAPIIDCGGQISHLRPLVVVCAHLYVLAFTVYHVVTAQLTATVAFNAFAAVGIFIVLDCQGQFTKVREFETTLLPFNKLMECVDEDEEGVRDFLTKCVRLDEASFAWLCISMRQNFKEFQNTLQSDQKDQLEKYKNNQASDYCTTPTDISSLRTEFPSFPVAPSQILLLTQRIKLESPQDLPKRHDPFSSQYAMEFCSEVIPFLDNKATTNNKSLIRSAFMTNYIVALAGIAVLGIEVYGLRQGLQYEIEDELDVYDPYQTACEKACDAWGFGIGGAGFPFTGSIDDSYDPYEPGCYVYESPESLQDLCFYGTGATEEEMAADLREDIYGNAIYRPEGYDCLCLSASRNTSV